MALDIGILSNCRLCKVEYTSMYAPKLRLEIQIGSRCCSILCYAIVISSVNLPKVIVIMYR
jgi:hypothetical protein